MNQIHEEKMKKNKPQSTVVSIYTSIKVKHTLKITIKMTTDKDLFAGQFAIFV